MGTVRALAAHMHALGDRPTPVGCFLDEAGGTREVGGLAVLGSFTDIAERHGREPFTVAVVSLPGACGPMALRVRGVLRGAGLVERVVPPLGDLLEGAVAAGVGSGAIDLVELIGRTPYGIDRRAVARVIEGKRVLITGAGGSIGSELCRIVASFRPSLLVMMERSENSLFEVDRQIARRFAGVERKALLHDVVDAEQTLRHLVAIKPHAVFHAAAHKHVPLMEDHPAHAVTNNLFGTKSIADAAQAVGAERFVMISSDKAVNPTSVMGATKRLAEMYVQALNTSRTMGRGARTSFSMVRFGNVLGSACSVLPIWSAQLAEGGPITVTDPRMTRYFMTINEAATLVIQAGAIDAREGETPTIFVLDMGEPIRIHELAGRFVRLSGFEVRSSGDAGHAGIEVQITGARPGEKLHEELAYSAEALVPTPYAGIMGLASSVWAEFDVAAMIADFSALRTSADRAAVLAAIRRHVPEMARPADEMLTEGKPVAGTLPASAAA